LNLIFKKSDFWRIYIFYLNNFFNIRKHFLPFLFPAIGGPGDRRRIWPGQGHGSEAGGQRA
jgi:hypothetical protein